MVKKFLVIGSKGAITYKDVFPYIKDGEMILGINPVNVFVSGDEIKKFGNIGWFSNLKTNREKKLVLTEKYSPEKYKKYDNYDAIEVSKVKDIPVDYYGVMGVPITILDKWDDSEFEIVGIAWDNELDVPWSINGSPTYIDDKHKRFKGVVLDNKALYVRILIKRKK